MELADVELLGQGVAASLSRAEVLPARLPVRAQAQGNPYDGCADREGGGGPGPYRSVPGFSATFAGGFAPSSSRLSSATLKAE